MRVENMTSARGNSVPNQFIIRSKSHSPDQVAYDTVVFQSYGSIIVKRVYGNHKCKTFLDARYWDYSRTTGKYRNQFLGEGIAETRKKIASGEYILTDLNA